jgi:hypothetical protein
MVPYCTKLSKVKSRHRLRRGLRLFDRLYLGKWSPVRTEHLQDRSLGPGNFFRLCNFKMYFDHMIDLKLHVHFIAATMADALETMHWEAKTDGRNVEFVLGGVPGNDEGFPSVLREMKVFART